MLVGWFLTRPAQADFRRFFPASPMSVAGSTLSFFAAIVVRASPQDFFLVKSNNKASSWVWSADSLLVPSAATKHHLTRCVAGLFLLPQLRISIIRVVCRYAACRRCRQFELLESGSCPLRMRMARAELLLEDVDGTLSDWESFKVLPLQ